MILSRFLDDAAPQSGIWPGLDEYRGPGGGYLTEPDHGIIDPIVEMMNRPGNAALLPDIERDVAVPIESLYDVRYAGVSKTRCTDYMIDDPSGLDPYSQVLGPVVVEDEKDPEWVGLSWCLSSVHAPKGVKRSGLCMNPIFMYHDFLTLTDDPERAIKAMGFSRAMRLSALSRAKYGGMRTLGVTRRRLFSMAMEYADDGTLDRFLAMVAAAHDRDLKRMMREYSDLPDGFVIETMRMKAVENSRKPRRQA